MDPAHERRLLAAEEDHYWFRARRRIVTDLIESLPLPPAPALLDAGTGGGRTLVELARFGAATGLEPSAPSLERARRRGVGTVVQAPLESMPFDPGNSAATARQASRRPCRWRPGARPAWASRRAG